MEILKSYDVNNVVYDIVITNWGEIRVKIGPATVLRQCTEEEAEKYIQREIERLG